MFKTAAHEYVHHLVVRNIMLWIGIKKRGPQRAKRKILALRHERNVSGLGAKYLAASPRPQAGHRLNERTFPGSGLSFYQYFFAWTDNCLGSIDHQSAVVQCDVELAKIHAIIRAGAEFYGLTLTNRT